MLCTLQSPCSQCPDTNILTELLSGHVGFQNEIKVRVMIFQYYMTSWVYISTVWCFLGADPEAVKRDVRYNNVAGILNHSYPTVNLLWAREEVLHNKTLPFIQFSISLWNTVHHDTEVSSNFRYGCFNIDLFQGIEVRNSCIMTTHSCTLSIRWKCLIRVRAKLNLRIPGLKTLQGPQLENCRK